MTTLKLEAARSAYVEVTKTLTMRIEDPDSSDEREATLEMPLSIDLDTLKIEVQVGPQDVVRWLHDHDTDDWSKLEVLRHLLKLLPQHQLDRILTPGKE